MTNIYFGPSQIILSEQELPELQGKEKTITLNSVERHDIVIFLEQMQSAGVTTGLIIYDAEMALKSLKEHFTVIQAAGGLIENGKNEILLIFRKGKWDFPKGKLDAGEDLETCAVREVEEETGVKATIQKPLCITYHTYFEKGEHILKESHWYLMKAEASSILSPQTEEDIEKCEWVKKENLEPYRNNMHRSIIDVLQKGMYQEKSDSQQ
jgi:8-oxo-dGTP pyrophosphatase MutT (NUDIX family)